MVWVSPGWRQPNVRPSARKVTGSVPRVYIQVCLLELLPDDRLAAGFHDAGAYEQAASMPRVAPGTCPANLGDSVADDQDVPNGLALVPGVDVARALCPGVLRLRVGEGLPGHVEP